MKDPWFLSSAVIDFRARLVITLSLMWSEHCLQVISVLVSVVYLSVT